MTGRRSRRRAPSRWSLITGSRSRQALLIAGWLGGTALLWRWQTLPEKPTGAKSSRKVSVVVPARNETRRITRLLHSLQGQADEVLVVDDESTDSTAAVSRRLGASVLPSGGPPAGWTGKSWACHVGSVSATGDVLVFLDADTWLAPQAIERIVAAHERFAPDGLLTVQPFHVTERWFEQVSALPNILATMGREVAFGPCLVTSADALASIGGFAAARDTVVEDIALGKAYRRAGKPVRNFGGGDAVRFRMYDSPAAVAEGWVKNLGAGFTKAHPLSTGISTLWVVAAAVAISQPLTYLMFAGQIAWMLRRLGRFRPWTSLFYPLPLAAFSGLFVASLTRHRVQWRGRVIER